MEIKTNKHYKNYVYIIGDGASCGMNLWYEGFIKVGMTNNFKNRLKSLQTASAKNFSIILVIGFNSKTEAEIVEKGIHEKLKFHKAKNEWFYFNKHTSKNINKFKVSFFNNITGCFL